MWAADFTDVPTWSGMFYVALVIDAYSRRILGWRAATSMRTSLVLDTLEMAIWARGRGGVIDLSGLIHHHDAAQYTPCTTPPNPASPRRRPTHLAALEPGRFNAPQLIQAVESVIAVTRPMPGFASRPGGSTSGPGMSMDETACHGLQVEGGAMTDGGNSGPSTMTPDNPRVFLSYRFAEHGAMVPTITAHLTEAGMEVISDVRLQWFKIRLDYALLGLLDQADLVLVLDPPSEDATPPAASLWNRIRSALRSAFNPRQAIEQFIRSADLPGRFRVIVAPGGWLASPDRHWLVRMLYRTVWGKQDSNYQQAGAMMLLLMLGPLLLLFGFYALLFGLCIVLARFGDTFVRRHFRGQDLARRRHESWQAWEQRIAGEVGVPVVSVWLQPDDPCMVTDVVPSGGVSRPLPAQRLGAAVLAVTGSLQRCPGKARRSTELKLWISTATVLVATAITVIGWLAVRYPVVRWVLILGLVTLAMRYVVRKLHQLVLSVLDRRRKRGTEQPPGVIGGPGSDGTPPS